MAGAAIAKGVAGMVPSAADKANKARIKELEKAKAAGQLGLSDKQQQARARAYMEPVAKAATQTGQMQARALAASGQGLSGSDLSAIRRDTNTAVGGAAQQARLQLDSDDEAAKAAQLNELEARVVAKSERNAAKRDNMFNAVSQAAGTMGSLAGAPPGTTGRGAYGAFGARAGSVVQALNPTQLPPDHQAAVQTIMQRPDAELIFKQAANGQNMMDPNVAYVAQLLRQSGGAGGVPNYTAAIPAGLSAVPAGG